MQTVCVLRALNMPDCIYTSHDFIFHSLSALLQRFQLEPTNTPTERVPRFFPWW